MPFQEIPAISILDRNIVLAQKDNYESLTIDEAIPDALDLIELITENYDTIYMTDINGFTRGIPQIKFIKALTDFCEVWLDAGVNDSEGIYDLFVAGAQNVVLSSKTLNDIFELAQAFEISENLIFQIDYSNGVLSPNIQIRDMTPLEIGNEIKDLGMRKVIFADLDRINTNKPLEREIIQSLINLNLEVFVGGGIKLFDVSMLKQLGTAGAIIELTNILKHGKVEF